MLPSVTAIKTKLAEYQDPILKQDALIPIAIKKIDITENKITLHLQLGYPLKKSQDEFIERLKKWLDVFSIPVDIILSWKIEPHVGQRGIKGLATIKNIIAVASGKGGVGKSTVAINLALSLSAEGARVGILDADIHGPSQPMMLGIKDMPDCRGEKVLLPVIAHGIQSMSIGYLIDEKTPMIWRGPMVSMALQQLLNDTQWDDVDYLIIDLPPGTGDIQLTLAQKIPVSGVVIVTTPQDLALLDVRRAYEMFQKVNVPVLGIVENMSVHICSECGHSEFIFGEGGAKKLADDYQIDFLGSLPLSRTIREQTDSGIPTAVSEPHSAHAMSYRAIALRAAAKLAAQPKDYSRQFPGIVVE